MTDDGTVSIERDADGAFTLDAGLVAEAFGWSVRELREMMRRGLVTSRVERGEGEDAGTWRLTLLCGNRRWLAVVGPDGNIAGSHVDFVASHPAVPGCGDKGG